MKVIKFIFLTITLLNLNCVYLKADSFNEWLISFKVKAIKDGISEKTLNEVMDDVIFLEKVIEYDRYQPEFYEDTNTYIGKRSSNLKLKNGLNLYNKYSSSIDNIAIEFDLEKELLLALMGIETNYGKYLGKMDILSSLATLSYDKRRSEFFTQELLILLRLIDKQIVNYKTLRGSWAGAFGNFQFMPSTIKNYAIDFDKNDKINLKSIDDSFASAANYLNKMGWKKDAPCFKKIKLNKNIPIKYLIYSARGLEIKKKYKHLKKYIINSNNLNIDDNVLVTIITPDKEIVDNPNILDPAYLVFSNYELILKWNRSLRFALAVCTLKNKFKNEL